MREWTSRWHDPQLIMSLSLRRGRRDGGVLTALLKDEHSQGPGQESTLAYV